MYKYRSVRKCFFLFFILYYINDSVNDNYSLYIHLGYFGYFSYETMIQYFALCCIVAYLCEPVSHVECKQRVG